MNPFKKFKTILENNISKTSLIELPFRWSEKHRFYHTTEHLTQIIADIEKNNQFDALNVFEKQALLLASFFHDAIYESKRKDNEEQSIKYFVYSYIGNDNKMLKTVCDLIKTTKYRKRPINKLERIFWDADNAKFKSGYDVLLKNEKLIRKEFSFLNNLDYKKKRIEFLKQNIGLFGISTDKNIKKLLAYIEKTYK